METWRVLPWGQYQLLQLVVGYWREESGNVEGATMGTKLASPACSGVMEGGEWKHGGCYHGNNTSFSSL